MQHILIAKKNNCKIVVADPRRTRTAAKSDHYVSLRPGSDAFIWGVLWHVFANKWEDKEFIRQRVFGMDEIREEQSGVLPEVERVTGVSEEDVYHTAKPCNRPGCIVWCMGGTQRLLVTTAHVLTVYLSLRWVTSVNQVSGANISVVTITYKAQLTAYCQTHYRCGLSEGSWRHWSKVWDIDFDWVKGRFDDNAYGGQKPVNSAGIPVSRWVDGVLEDKDKIRQRENIRAMFYWGHAVNSQTAWSRNEKGDAEAGYDGCGDPYSRCSGNERSYFDGVYLLPATTQFETYGGVTASDRSLQWRDKVVDPLFESKPDHEIMYLLSKTWISLNSCSKTSVLRTTSRLSKTSLVNSTKRTISYRSKPERLKEHQQNWHIPTKRLWKQKGGAANGETYGLPWPCWGAPEDEAPRYAYLAIRRSLLHRAAITSVLVSVWNLKAKAYWLKTATRRQRNQRRLQNSGDEAAKQLGWWDD